MSFLDRHFLDFQGISAQKISSFFLKASKLDFSTPPPTNAHIVGHLFFEPSTRTQLSFNTATLRCGAQPLLFMPENSSLKKGETFLDTLLTVQSMGVSCLVIRHGYRESLRKDIVPYLKVPVINAGEGISGHPTQALLDGMTILQERGKIEGEKIVFIGDIEHSRVAKSNFELLSLMGAKLGICGPREWLPKNSNFDFHHFENLSQGLKWATVCMALRIQKERHDSDFNLDFNQFQLNKNVLKDFDPKGIILHPGPFNREVEITSDVLNDPRCAIWKQVSNGVKVRTALLQEVLGL